MTPHIAAEKGDIAEKILLPGDPLRAKYIAETYLDEPKCFNEIRNMFGYTGYYKGERVSVMGTGMGIPSMTIYSHELITVYGVKELIRIGSCGSYQEDVGLNDLILVQGASTDSAIAGQLELKGHFSALADSGLLKRAWQLAEEKEMKYHVGGVITSDVFYDAKKDYWKDWSRLGVLAVEMECYGLYLNAAKLGAKALSILTVSDLLYSEEMLTSQEREQSLKDMIELGLEI